GGGAWTVGTALGRLNDSDLIPPDVSIAVGVLGGSGSSLRSRAGGCVCGRDRRSNRRPLALVNCRSMGGPTGFGLGFPVAFLSSLSESFLCGLMRGAAFR